MDYPNRVIKAGETDASIVTAIQQRLTELGVGDLQSTGIFGPKTVAAVKQFQASHTDSYGNPLIADGKVGPITWAVLFGTPVTQPAAAPTPLLAKAVEVAKGQIGVMEVPPGSNSGPMVNQFLASTGTPPGNNWCAAFVYWCFDQAAQSLGVPNPLVKTAGCLDHWNRTTGTKILTADAVNNPSLIVPGSIFIRSYGNGFGHTGIVSAVNGGFMETIEGNSNNNGSRDGEGVFLLESRKINSIEKGFIIYQ
ncbi:CHAP domain-containing protein [Chitinophaga vietnamensis]|uniref:CHAP domain-containing protein n=1 Tax=Chitinophaga vietnamensis TaxID=2593957 RepID=UPI001178C7FE|nr:CHAP domain-containing protein [Chitinophaga vietnamensis]